MPISKHARDARDPALQADTRAYILDRIAIGCRQLTLAQVKAELAALGYGLRREGPYTNDYASNKPHRWLAMMCTAVHVATGLSFSDVECPDTTLPQLQRLRLDVVVVHEGRIWEV